MSKKTTGKVPLMAEQLLLVKTECELKKMIELVNGQLNQLLVEELQLKSNAIRHLTANEPAATSAATPSTSSSQSLTTAELEFKLDAVAEVNRQELQFVDVNNWIAKVLEDEEDEELDT